jgi:hypothetical protein
LPIVSRTAKAGLLVSALVGLLVIVALASQGGPPTVDGRVAPRPVPTRLQDSLVTLFAIAYAIAIVAVIIILFRRHGHWEEPEESRWLRNLVILMVFFAIVTAFGYWAIRHADFRHEDEQAQRGQGQGQTTRPGKRRLPPVATRRADFQWELALGIAGLVALAGVYVVLRRRDDREVHGDTDTLEAELIRTVETTIDDLRNEPDPRRAVIASYANMERALASHGMGRRRSEAPLEYLTRVLGGLSVRPAAVRSLTALFEHAKFSDHEITPELKEEAIAALSTVRDDLADERRAA